jgi:hypothetical protein
MALVVPSLASIVSLLAWFSATVLFVKTLLTDVLGFNKPCFTLLLAQFWPF